VAIARLSPIATPLRAALDVLAWAAAATLALYLRFDLDPPQSATDGLKRVVPLVAGSQLVLGWAIGLYRRRWLYGSYDEMAAVLLTAAVTTAGLFVLNQYYFTSRPIPQSVVLVGGIFGLVAMAAIRYVWRLLVERIRRPASPDAERVIVYGANEDGVRVVVSLLRDQASTLIPVAFLDDEPSRQRLSVMGVSVRGGRHDLAKVTQRTMAQVLLIADSKASPELVGELVDLAAPLGLVVKVLPSVESSVRRSGPADIRDLPEADLLGRHQVQTNVEAIAHYLRGRTVLVTGAGGSIGSELCRQISTFGPGRLVMLDRDESALHAVELSIQGRALLDDGLSVLCDIRDAPTLSALFRQIRPDVVFHAAALKHLPLLEQFPDEAYKTNVQGSLNVLRAAAAVGVSVFVNVSTDKAANPISVLGYSKRVAERLTSAVGIDSPEGRYLSVRFGNVLGSRGSVLTSFRDQIARGGPVTVTSRDVTRYFMTVQEAVQLVIQAGAIGRTGEVLVLDMGKPVRIYDVARRLIAQSGRRIDIEITGMRSGEKLHEELFGRDEVDARPFHPLISHTAVPPIDVESVAEQQPDAAAWMTAQSSPVAQR
jgi:FlaA1/EpsC-like NDP-sugar epimerase